jgi:hypothetical protein
LEEDVPNESIVSKVAAAMEDLREEIVIGSKVHDDVSVAAFLHNAVEGNHARMRRCELVQGDFSYMNLALTWGLMPRRDKALDCIGLWGSRLTSVNGAINNTIASNTQDID